MFFEKIAEYTVYENPNPALKSRCAKFPGIVKLSDGELLAMFELGEAFESVDSHTVISRSRDSGKTWQFQGEVYDMSQLKLSFAVSETLKPMLCDGMLIATGYRFHRQDLSKTIGNPETGGILPADDVILFSKDHGRTWTLPKVIEHNFPEPVEFSGPCIESTSGHLLGTGTPFKMWNGSNPSGHIGILFRSTDRGLTWDTTGRFLIKPGNAVIPFESRLIEMQPNRLITISWAYDAIAEKNLNNIVTVSHDNGYTWSDPIDTQILGQASNLLWIGGEQLLSIHAQREVEIGLYVRLIDFKNDKWKVEGEGVIWGKMAGDKSAQSLIDQFQNLKFGQPSLLRLSSDTVLAYHWCVENMLYKIKAHLLKLHI